MHLQSFIWKESQKEFFFFFFKFLIHWIKNCNCSSNHICLKMIRVGLGTLWRLYTDVFLHSSTREMYCWYLYYRIFPFMYKSKYIYLYIFFQETVTNLFFLKSFLNQWHLITGNLLVNVYYFPLNILLWKNVVPDCMF